MPWWLEEPAMTFTPSGLPRYRAPARARPEPPPVSVKFVVAGGFGVGKTTFVATISEITPVHTEAALTEASAGTDDRSLVGQKVATTVAMDFGRVTADHDLFVYLFGTPGQERFGFMWDDITAGAVGVLILVDPRRLADSYPAIDYVEHRQLPFVVVLNHFDTRYRPDQAALRYTLNLEPGVPVLDCDARDHESVSVALIALLEHVVAGKGRP
jgi:uncharacterized protein